MVVHFVVWFHSKLREGLGDAVDVGSGRMGQLREMLGDVNEVPLSEKALGAVEGLGACSMIDIDRWCIGIC